MKSKCFTVQLKANEQYFPLVARGSNLPVNEILKYDDSNLSY